MCAGEDDGEGAMGGEGEGIFQEVIKMKPMKSRMAKKGSEVRGNQGVMKNGGD